MAGRPKTLNKDHALATALEAYWRQGIYGMSVNEVCRRAGISKPGLYREFGGEEGLKTAVLKLYREIVVSRFGQLLKAGLSFNDTMEKFVSIFFENDHEHPPGCLLAEYRLAYDDLGPTTQDLVREMVKEYRSILRNWLQACAEQGDIPQSTDLDFAAQYVDSCLRNAATIAKRGGDPKLVAKNFLTSLQVLHQHSATATATH